MLSLPIVGGPVLGATVICDVEMENQGKRLTLSRNVFGRRGVLYGLLNKHEIHFKRYSLDAANEEQLEGDGGNGLSRVP